MSRLLEGIYEILYRFFLVSFEHKHLITIIPELIYRSKVRDPSEIKKELYLLFSETIDIYTLLGDEHLELSLDLGWTVRIRTI